VVGTVTAADIPGKNTTGEGIFLFVPVGQDILCVGAAVGVILATNELIANQACTLVKVIYEET
jgi:CO/xanthine dehydrogenase Mo-binding subunit